MVRLASFDSVSTELASSRQYLTVWLPDKLSVSLFVPLPSRSLSVCDALKCLSSYPQLLFEYPSTCRFTLRSYPSQFLALQLRCLSKHVSLPLIVHLSCFCPREFCFFSITLLSSSLSLSPCCLCFFFFFLPPVSMCLCWCVDARVNAVFSLSAILNPINGSLSGCAVLCGCLQPNPEADRTEQGLSGA